MAIPRFEEESIDYHSGTSEGIGTPVCALVRIDTFYDVFQQQKPPRPQQDGVVRKGLAYASIFMMLATRMPQGGPMT